MGLECPSKKLLSYRKYFFTMTDSRDRRLDNLSTEQILDELARRIANSPDPDRYLDEVIRILREKLRQHLAEKSRKTKRLGM